MTLAWKALLQSRKFWLTVIATIGALVLYLQGVIQAEQLADALVALAGILVGAIAFEDAAEKHGGRRSGQGGA